MSWYVNRLPTANPLGTAATTSSPSSTTAISTNTIFINSATGQTYLPTSSGTVTAGTIGDNSWEYIAESKDIEIRDGDERTIKLPDGTRIEVAKDGSFKIADKDAKVIYRANRMRDFNPFLNVSDKLEEFIEFCGANGVRKTEMMELPINLFIGWLVIQAAKADREPEPDIPLLPDLRKRAVLPRCPSCGRFTAAALRAKKIEFCKPVCFENYFYRQEKNMLTKQSDSVTISK